MPVTLVAFNARAERGAANLAWSTAEETNSDHFEKQHSTDGRQWRAIGSIESGHKSVTTRHYTFTHTTPPDGTNYYRLKMVDYDRSFAFSAIRSVLISIP